ncbi:unnamed protein product [Medioppia subpectinata]|uniref:Ig-like domain-containing protein n=1 Tax=Medioppia subpectinata TaxID=1979941 RepID=A0A7R9KIY9_9ACAR|nr:unnamed protein product [Medioppia subpectinata]CAG2104558.1 unnamed protein product [Medioppia subpectinata]
MHKCNGDLLSGILIIGLFSVINSNGVQSRDLPSFADQLNNITVAVGRDAAFQCVVHNLKKDFQDSGEYMCQINTNPMISQSGFLQVVVPPRFTQKFTSSDEEVREDSSVSLRCSASGFPKPHIKWRREDGQPINIQPIQPNGTTKLSQKESHPKAITSWIRDSDRAIIHSNAKYSTSVESTDSEYRSEIRCLAKNTLGEVEASIKLFEAPKSSSEPKFAKEYKSKNKNTYQTMISVGFDDRGDGDLKI